ncbi:cell envelope integrity protein TolA [Acidovorax sp.]|uniref:cell envelope integrity protein TolA n=1 Tax=Acidovorax sp. TaxID=1872122 RepID=UPI00261DCA8F|nr:cell envelope integrity protein TolA [Acidovorax sp.]
MHALDDRDQFYPPRPPARLRAITLALLTHAVLIGALTWGVNWKSTADRPAVEAELWAAVPTQAAPRAVDPPPPPPTPVPTPPPPAPPVRTVQPPDTREADIAIEREKKRLEQEKKAREQQQEREKRERERKEEERRDRLEQEKKERLQKEREKEQREKQQAEQKKKAEQEKQKKLAEDKRKAEAEAKQLAEQREANLRRIQGLAGATGGANATGTALRNAGPSGSYGGKVAAKVKPNIVYPDMISGNPRAEVEVRLSPDGTIVGKRLVQSSGNKAWDDAVLRALDKTETLPRDVDGRVPSSLTIGFRPQD